MRFLSTKKQAPAVSFGEAVAQGLAPDGGLYVPKTFPSLSLADFEGARTLPEVAEVMLRPFVGGDPIAGHIGAVTRDAFDFPAPLRPVSADGLLSVLELFHGPTAAF